MLKIFFLILTVVLLGDCAGPVSENLSPTPGLANLSPTVAIPADTVLSATAIPSPKPAVQPTAFASTTPPPNGPASNGLHFSDQPLGVSFDYPQDWSILPRASDDPPGITLHGPTLGPGPEPIIFAITIDILPVTEKSVSDLVDQQLAQVPPDLTGGIKRKAVLVDGEPAEQIIGLPSLGGAIETFVLHEGQLFLIILQPFDESNNSLVPYLPQAHSLYDSFLATWKFLK